MTEAMRRFELQAFVVSSEARAALEPYRDTWFQWSAPAGADDNVSRIVCCDDSQSVFERIACNQALGLATYVITGASASPLAEELYRTATGPLWLLDVADRLGETLERLCYPEAKVLRQWEELCAQESAEVSTWLPPEATFIRAYGEALREWRGTLHDEDVTAYMPAPDRVFLRREFSDAEPSTHGARRSTHLIDFPAGWIESGVEGVRAAGVLAEPVRSIRVAHDDPAQAFPIEKATAEFWQQWFDSTHLGTEQSMDKAHARLPATPGLGSPLRALIDWFAPPVSPDSELAATAYAESVSQQREQKRCITFGEGRLTTTLWRFSDEWLAIYWEFDAPGEIEFRLASGDEDTTYTIDLEPVPGEVDRYCAEWRAIAPRRLFSLEVITPALQRDE